MIVSHLNDLVLDVSEASDEPGAKVITWERSEDDNQLWYLDSTTGTIRSKQTDFCLDIDGENVAKSLFWGHKSVSIRSAFSVNFNLTSCHPS